MHVPGRRVRRGTVSSDSRAGSDVVVLGGGMIGAAVAWRCAARGLAVTVVDPDPGRGAWHTPAGMLAAATELHTTETPLLHLNLDSAARWPGFAAELAADCGRDVGFQDCGTVLVGWDGADLTALRMLHEFAASLQVATEWVDGAALRELEPGLAAGLPGGLLAPGDHSVDPRLVHAGLLDACAKHDVRFVRSVGAVLVDREQVRGVRVEGGTVLPTRQVVLAAGAWSGAVEGLPEPVRPRVRPVKGQTIRLHLAGRPRLRHVLRGSVRGSAVYVVPRPDGTLVVGASSEEAGFATEPRAGAVYELLRDAQALLPELGEAAVRELCVGLRPGSPDNAPLIGPTGLAGLTLATGHFRNGVLLAPVTAEAVADLLTGAGLPSALAPFDPQRGAA